MQGLAPISTHYEAEAGRIHEKYIDLAATSRQATVSEHEPHALWRCTCPLKASGVLLLQALWWTA